jgi:hypothetical protein
MVTMVVALRAEKAAFGVQGVIVYNKQGLHWLCYISSMVLAIPIIIILC